jgi:TonB family protein
MIAVVLQELARANLVGAAAILAVLALRRPVRQRFGARAAYALWVAVPLTALAGLAPRPRVTLLEPVTVTANALTAGAKALGAPADPSLPGLLLLTWIAGALAMTAILATLQARYMRRPGDAGPAVVGVIRPRIVTPADFETRFDAEERRVILAHEQVHLARGDSRINGLVALAQCLCWFNPLVHVAARTLRIDQELACDAAVVDRYPAARPLYARLLLKTQLASQALPLGCHWPARAAHPLKERIAMLKSPQPRPLMRQTGLAAVALLGVAGAGLAWAAQPAPPPHIIQKPDWVRRPTAENVKAIYPADALRQRMEGSALIACRVSLAGSLEGCKVVNEAPAGQAFGKAALDLTPMFQMRPQLVDGKPVAGGVVRIPIRFKAPAPREAS